MIGVESWRNENPKYQLKTLGGVYFYSAPSAMFNDINEQLYDKLPKYVQKSVVMLDVHKSIDGNHYEIFYVDNNGVIQYFDEYGMSDFMFGLRQLKNESGTVSDWNYGGDYKEGMQLRNKEA